ncbi:YbaK/prolyl-tRNA synthetase-related family protein [Striga asiatica]|uniref:YbaK/prolyl-tRNA synthetase-related family protein n=1 Tax=Striga asiatica TaxID=4170 RepID=A0A5A7P6B1_STRAF|nr:YbaK/prolyl-tRNA synthetase-related family protein [Striga asiatica]
MEALADLEKVQTRILGRISDLELSITTKPSHNPSCAADDGGPTTTEGRLSAILAANAVKGFSFKRVPSDYYDWTLEARRDVLGAASIHHLCKSIVLVNTQAPPDVTDCSNRNYSKYYVVVVQYTARFNAETVKNFLYTLNDGKISKKKFNNKLFYRRSAAPIVFYKMEISTLTRVNHAVRLAPEEASAKLTGYEHNGVTCIGMKTDIPHIEIPHSSKKPTSMPMIFIQEDNLAFLQQFDLDPVILDEAIVKLTPDFFWLGGGEIDLKLGIRTSEFIDYVKPFIINCSGS